MPKPKCVSCHPFWTTHELCYLQMLMFISSSLFHSLYHNQFISSSTYPKQSYSKIKSHNQMDRATMLVSIVVTDRVRSTREGKVFSLSTPGGGGGCTRARSSGGGGGYLSQVQLGGGYPDVGGGVPHLEYPPCQTWLGVTPAGGTSPWVPHVRHGQGVPQQGVPHLGHPPIRPGWGVPQQGGTSPWVPPCQTWPGGTPVGGTPPRVPLLRPGQGGYPNGEGVPHRVVLDTPRLVCLLRSRRRTFL